MDTNGELVEQARRLQAKAKLAYRIASEVRQEAAALVKSLTETVSNDTLEETPDEREPEL